MFSQGFTVSGSSLKLLKAGERGIVTRLRDLDDLVSQRIRAIGIAPGTLIVVEQRFPRFTVKIGGNRFILDDRVIEAIYVRIGSSQKKMAIEPRQKSVLAASLN